MFAIRSSRSLLPLAAGAGLFASTFKSTHCEVTKPIPEKYNLPVTAGNILQEPLFHVGTGMRSKSLYITSVDIYKVHFKIPLSLLPEVKKWARSDIKTNSLSSVLTSIPLVNGPLKNIQSSITLEFQRNLSKAQFIDAIALAFKGVDPDNYKQFEELISDCIGDSVVKGDKVTFIFLNNGSLLLLKNGEFKSSLSLTDITTRLYEVYLSNERSVCPNIFADAVCGIEKLDKYINH